MRACLPRMQQFSPACRRLSFRQPFQRMDSGYLMSPSRLNHSWMTTFERGYLTSKMKVFPSEGGNTYKPLRAMSKLLVLTADFHRKTQPLDLARFGIERLLF